MIEKAIFISNTKNLGYVTHAYSRLYFGIEFCERLIPSREELSAAIEFAGRNKMDFTFVTPFVTDNGMEKLARLLDCFSGDQRGSEIVINDWGFLRVLKERSWQGAFVLGRLLTKQKRGPTIMNIMHILPKDALEHFKQCSADVGCDFLAHNNISRIELDNQLQGISRPGAPLKASLYSPYAYITTTRYCTMSPYNGAEKPSFRSIRPCNKECQESEHTLDHPSMPVRILLRGNTQFFKNETMPRDLEALHIDRVVFEPVIPV